MEHLCAVAAAIKLYIHGNNWQFCSQYRLSMTGTQKLSSTSYQAPLPPSGCLKEEKDFFWKFYIQRQRHLMVTVLHVTLGGGFISICPWQKPGCDWPRHVIHYSFILNILEGRQDAHEIKIWIIVLQDEVALHLSGID